MFSPSQVEFLEMILMNTEHEIQHYKQHFLNSLQENKITLKQTTAVVWNTLSKQTRLS